MDYVWAFVAMLNAMSPYLMLGFFIAGVLHAFVPATIYSRYLAGNGFRPVALAALFGVPLPLCSCGVLPTAVALRRSGASRAASTSFLIATLPFAILRPVAALVTALAGGLAVGRLERKGGEAEADAAPGNYEFSALKPTLAGRMVEALRYGFFEMMQNIGRWFLLGLVVATLITVLVPDDFFSTYARYPLLNMVLILIVAVPMYICATGSIPIAAALMLKGLSPGCALVMLMAGPAANVASMLVIGKAFGRRTTIAYLASIVVGAMAFGLIVDYWPGMREAFTAAMPCHVMHHAMGTSWLNAVCSVLLMTMLLVAMVAKYRKSYQIKNNKTTEMKEFNVKGMMCNHCKATVENGLSAMPGVQKVTVDLATGKVFVEGDVTAEAVREKIEQLGYQCPLDK